jgi:hypothetical protein
MRPVLRRIAIHGGLTVVVLGIIGMMLAELVTIWMSATFSQRSPVKGTGPDTTAMRRRLPLFMAGSGFAIVAVGEVALFFWRKNRVPVSVQRTSDTTEKLLEELLAQAESKTSNPQGSVAPTGPASENTPTHAPPSHSPGGES